MKRILAVILVIVLSFSFALVGYAEKPDVAPVPEPKAKEESKTTEESKPAPTTPPPAVPQTETKEEETVEDDIDTKAVLTEFSVALKIPDGFDRDIRVSLEEEGTGLTRDFTLTKERDYKPSDTQNYILVKADTTYIVKIGVAVSNSADAINYKIIDSITKELPSKIETKKASLRVSWEIITDTDNTRTGTTAADSSTQGSSTLDIEAVLKTLSVMEDNPEYTDVISLNTGKVFENKFLSIEGNTQAMWDSKTPYERFCYHYLYVSPRSILLGVNSTELASSKDVFLHNYYPLENQLEVFEINATEEEKADIVNAIKTTWEWHFDNWETQRVVLNPFDNTVVAGEKDVVEDTPEFELTEEEKKELGVEDNKDNVDKEPEKLTIVSAVKSTLKRNVIAVVLLIGAAAGLLVVRYRKRLMNLEDEVDEDEDTTE